MEIVFIPSLYPSLSLLILPPLCLPLSVSPSLSPLSIPHYLSLSLYLPFYSSISLSLLLYISPLCLPFLSLPLSFFPLFLPSLHVFLFISLPHGSLSLFPHYSSSSFSFSPTLSLSLSFSLPLSPSPFLLQSRFNQCSDTNKYCSYQMLTAFSSRRTAAAGQSDTQ